MKFLNDKFIRCFFKCCLKELGLQEGLFQSLFFIEEILKDWTNGVHTLLLDVSMNASDSTTEKEEV